ncbi:DUF6678 family protein [Bowmanella pacifica]|uniref:Uncharacterized protein n=1 Tax=Bowmanella pacifica TaxID=502051 RepID=A0A917Z0A4_9ALTE|nr:DUF6678 family protein [Bowmanella pacifica]GGO71536.1 hypothetical protein GCM10010982_27550 [Bowmanella pacifica]
MNEKLLKIINERQLVSVMNKTKWREVCEDFEELDSPHICIRYKLITSDDIFGFSPVWWDQLLEDASAIEWLDFEPVVSEHRGRLVSNKKTDRSAEILSILRRHSIRYSNQESYFRVWGYLTPGDCPEFV